LGGFPTFGENAADAEVAPLPAARESAMEPRSSTRSRH
jgi:hypothetical protein